MLTLTRCKEILGERATHLSDEQILTLRDSLYGIVNLIFDNIEKKEVKSVQLKRNTSAKVEDSSSVFAGVQPVSTQILR